MTDGMEMESQERSRRIFLAKVLLTMAASLILFFWMNPGFPHRFFMLKTLAGKGIFLFTFLLAWGALLACTIAHRVWAAIFLLFFAVNLLISTTYARVMGRSMNLNDAQNLREAMGSILDAVRQYSGTVGFVSIMILGLVALLLWSRKQVQKRSSIPLIACSLGVSLSYGSFLARGGAASMLCFPANFESGMHAMALYFEPMVRHRVHKHEQPLVTQELPLDAAVKNVVLIIDESVEATAFEEVMKGVRIPNAKDLGIGYSYENSSAGSNLMLRRAADPHAVDQSIREFPSLFEVAKKHGYSTTYLDAQGILSDGDVADYIDAKDTNFIDTLPPLKDFGPRHMRDIQAVGMLADVFAKHERNFVLVNKQGSHFPYAKNLPPELAGVADPYRASLERTSTGFLAALAAKLPPGTLVFYTSDHGQNFKARAPHNNAPGESSVAEWSVPLVVLFSDDLKGWADRIPTEWNNHGTHAALAESVRNLLGVRNPGMESLHSKPTAEEMIRHRAYYGSPKGLFGEPVLSLWIDKDQRAFTAPPQQSTRAAQ